MHWNEGPSYYLHRSSGVLPCRLFRSLKIYRLCRYYAISALPPLHGPTYLASLHRLTNDLHLHPQLGVVSNWES